MGAPKEVWVCSSKMGTPVYVYDEAEPAVRAAKHDGALLVHRYVLARPKREAVAWVVRFDEDGRRYACVDDVAITSISPRAVNWTRTNALQFAHRFVTRESAECYARAVGIHVARIVKLVRPVKP